MDAGKRPPGPDLRALALAYTAGVLAVHALSGLPSLTQLFAATLTLVVAHRLRPYWAMALLGVALTTWQAQRQIELRWPESRHNEPLLVSGQVASLPELKLATGRKGEPEQTWRFLFRPDSAELPLVRVSWYRSAAQLKGGECWQLQLRMKTPHGSLNPGGFDYEAWLFRQGIGATATVKSGERCESTTAYPVLQLRQSIADQLRTWLPQHSASALLVALIVGDDSGITDTDWNVFRLTGTSHLIAISGFNIGIVAGAAFFLLRWLWSLWPRLCLRAPAQRVGMLGSAVAATVYALLAGFEPPVLRALLMLLVMLGAYSLNRLSQASHVLALAWLAILLADPFAVMSPGLWLSFGAVAAIFYVSTQRLGSTGLLRGFIALQLMLSLLLAPLSLYFFQGTSWAGPLVNLLAVPLFALLTPLALLAALLAAILPVAGLLALQLVADLLAWFRLALEWISGQPQLWWPDSPPASALALSLMGGLLLFAPRGLPLKTLGVLCFLPLLFPPTSAPRDGVELTALDVGQGLAVVVRTAQHTLLFDAGPAFDEGFDAGESVVAPWLLSRGVRDLDLMLISHGDNDHIGGAPAIRRLLNVREELGTDRPCREGQAWDWDGVHFELLHPGAGHWSDNNGSCVLRVETSGHVLLLPGDIEKGAEARLLQMHPQQLRADVLLAPHHGSKTSSTAGFVAAVQPQLVIHSAGWRHHFGHPHPSVVQRYADAGARQYQTGRQGALSLHLGADGIPAVREWRREAAHWWNAPAEVLLEPQPPPASAASAP